MKEKFSKRIQNIIKKAKEEAIRMGHSYVGSEHLLLGLFSQKSGMSKKIFDIYDLDLNQIIKMTEDMINTSSGTMTLGHLPLTRRAERIIRNAYREASKNGVDIADDHHLLLAFLKESDGLVYEILDSISLVFEDVNELINSDKTDLKEKLFSRKVSNDTEKETPTVDHFSRDITQLSKDDKLDPVIGRENEINRVIQILSRRKKNNPILIGEPGVGKTAIIEGLAQRISNKTVPRSLYKKRILSLDLALIISGTKYRGQFEERLKNILDEIKNNGNIIIFIDEIHTIVGAGSSSGSLDASNMIKPSLARAEIHCIGATTLDEYRNYIENDGALERRFQKVLVNEPSKNETFKILNGLKRKYENYHRVKYTPEALKACVSLSERYLSDRYLPDKAIDIMDEAGARAHLINFKIPRLITKIEKEISELKKEKETKVLKQLFEEAAIIRDKEKKVNIKLDNENKKWESKELKNIVEINFENIADIVSLMTEIPLTKIKKTESNQLLNLDRKLKKYIIGQGKAIDILVKAVKRSRTGINNPERPVGVFLFLGPTGVGKTELAKVFARNVYLKKDSIIKIDMSEFKQEFTSSRLLGSPPGYIGYEKGGDLTEKVRRNPYSVILFDEIEKAHPNIFNIFLQIFDEGILTDSLGRKINFRNSIIIMTSNMGTKKFISKGYGFGGNKGSKSFLEMKKQIMKEVEKIFSPELINRIDESVIFNSLTKPNVYKIIDLQMIKTIEILKKKKITIKLDRSAKNLLANEGYNPKYGVRHLRRKFQTLIENPISDMLLRDELSSNSLIIFSSKENKISYKIINSKIVKEKNKDLPN
tara:strand:- start:467 stop:2935 length:2469 start_codon:yes stop_codon:yes gene_type:complete